jgi:hypothetical protein
MKWAERPSVSSEKIHGISEDAKRLENQVLFSVLYVVSSDETLPKAFL